MSESKLNMGTVKNALRSATFWKPVVGTLAGGLLGYLYYYYIGCASGTCPLTSNPYSSVLFGAAFGYYILSSLCNRC